MANTDPRDEHSIPNGKRCTDSFDGSDYTAEQLAYLVAVEAFKRKHQVRYPALTDYLRIALEMGYRLIEPPTPPPV